MTFQPLFLLKICSIFFSFSIGPYGSDTPLTVVPCDRAVSSWHKPGQKWPVVQKTRKFQVQRLQEVPGGEFWKLKFIFTNIFWLARVTAFWNRLTVRWWRRGWRFWRKEPEKDSVWLRTLCSLDEQLMSHKIEHPWLCNKVSNWLLHLSKQKTIYC